MDAEQAKLSSDDAMANDNFGLSVDISGESLLSSEQSQDLEADNSFSGSAYVFVT